jgi:hypothetical protein
MKRIFFLIFNILSLISFGQYITEINYDIPGTDAAGSEFVEVFYPTGINNTDFSIIRINGNSPSSGVVYNTPAFTSVVCSNVTGGQLCVYTGSQDCLQNGVNDAVILFNNSTMMVTQAIAYEGNVTVSTSAMPTAIQGLVISSVGTDSGSSPDMSLNDHYNSGSFTTGEPTPGSYPPLSVKFSELSIKSKKEGNILEFSTLSEYSNDYFVIERSKDAIEFYPIGEINGAEYSSNRIYYQYVDNKPESGVSYYRVKQVDFDGQFAYSNVVGANYGYVQEITVSNRNNMLQIYTMAEDYNVFVYNTTGQAVMMYMNLNKDQNIEIQGLEPGLFFVKTQYDQHLETHKIHKF